MTNTDLITIREAAAVTGRSKKLLQSLVERGALPAVRQDGKWLVSRTDLARLYTFVTPEPPGPPKGLSPAKPAPAPPAAETPADAGRDARADAEQHHTIDLLVDLLRQRDEQVARLQDDRAQLTAQIGFLQGLLVEREARLQLIEALPAARALPSAAEPAAIDAADTLPPETPSADNRRPSAPSLADQPLSENPDPAPAEPLAAASAAEVAAPRQEPLPESPVPVSAGPSSEVPPPPPEPLPAADEAPAPTLDPFEPHGRPQTGVRRSGAVLLVRRLLGRRH